MRAGEEKLETIVGKVRHLTRLHFCIKHFDSLGGAGPCRGPAAVVTGDPARGGDQPGLWAVRHAGPRPGFKRPGERLGQRVLCGGDVAGAGGDDGKKAPIALPRRGLCSLMGASAAHPVGFIITGRISTEPYSAAGDCSAHLIAASRSSTSSVT